MPFKPVATMPINCSIPLEISVPTCYKASPSSLHPPKGLHNIGRWVVVGIAVALAFTFLVARLLNYIFRCLGWDERRRSLQTRRLANAPRSLLLRRLFSRLGLARSAHPMSGPAESRVTDQLPIYTDPTIPPPTYQQVTKHRHITVLFIRVSAYVDIAFGRATRVDVEAGQMAGSSIQAGHAPPNALPVDLPPAYPVRSSPDVAPRQVPVPIG